MEEIFRGRQKRKKRKEERNKALYVGMYLFFESK